MSNLSFARIMYGAAQEQPSYGVLPFSNSTVQISASSGAPYPSLNSPSADAESLLQKAWHAITRHN